MFFKSSTLLLLLLGVARCTFKLSSFNSCPDISHANASTPLPMVDPMVACVPPASMCAYQCLNNFQSKSFDVRMMASEVMCSCYPQEYLLLEVLADCIYYTINKAVSVGG